MAGMIELHAFMFLQELFRERHWDNPSRIEVDQNLSGLDLLKKLNISADRVEVIFVNHTAFQPQRAIINPGDRVALVPPGVPGPHRFLLGFKNED
jgi:sulfur carrier protein ThiS